MSGIVKKRGVAGIHLLLLWLLGPGGALAQSRWLPPAPPPVALGSQWFQLDAATDQLKPCLPGLTPPTATVFQWLRFSPGQAARFGCRARAGLALFVDNELVLLAPVTGQYTIDLHRFAAHPGSHLVACWFPPTEGRVSEAFELLANPEAPSSPTAGSSVVPLRKRNADPNRDVFILMLLSIGLLFGALRVTYGFSLSRFLRFQMVTRERLDDVRGANNTPLSTPLTVLLVFAFLLSFSLFVTMIHTKLENNLLSRYLFTLSDADVTLRVGFYTLLGLVFIAARYAFLWIIGYVFDLSAVVLVQYREFVQTLIFAGLYLPLIIVLHLALSVRAPAIVLLFSNTVVFALIGVLVVRTGLEIRRRQSLLNLQLFSYLCATEVIPLTVLLKLIVFPST